MGTQTERAANRLRMAQVMHDVLGWGSVEWLQSVLQSVRGYWQGRRFKPSAVRVVACQLWKDFETSEAEQSERMRIVQEALSAAASAASAPPPSGRPRAGARVQQPERTRRPEPPQVEDSKELKMALEVARGWLPREVPDMAVRAGLLAAREVWGNNAAMVGAAMAVWFPEGDAEEATAKVLARVKYTLCGE